MTDTRQRTTLGLLVLLAACSTQPGDANPGSLARTAEELTVGRRTECLTPRPELRKPPREDVIVSKPGKVPAAVKAAAKGAPGKRDGAPPPPTFAISDEHRAKRAEFLVKLADLKAKTSDPVKFGELAAALKMKSLGE